MTSFPSQNRKRPTKKPIAPTTKYLTICFLLAFLRRSQFLLLDRELKQVRFRSFVSHQSRVLHKALLMLSTYYSPPFIVAERTMSANSKRASSDISTRWRSSSFSCFNFSVSVKLFSMTGALSGS